jgi:hypothetical protein
MRLCDDAVADVYLSNLAGQDPVKLGASQERDGKGNRLLPR